MSLGWFYQSSNQGLRLLTMSGSKTYMARLVANTYRFPNYRDFVHRQDSVKFDLFIWQEDDGYGASFYPKNPNCIYESCCYSRSEINAMMKHLGL